MLEGLVDRNITVRPPQADVSYIAGCDASGGRGDSFTAAISHRDKHGIVYLDLLFERKSPFSPSQVVDEIAQLMRQYRCTKVTGDAYAAGWVPEAFLKVGIRYEKSEFDRSGVYMNVLPALTAGRCRLIDSNKLISQFSALERRVFPTGKERVDPGPGHDDLANSASIALSLADLKRGPITFSPAARERFKIPIQPSNRFGTGPRTFWSSHSEY